METKTHKAEMIPIVVLIDDDEATNYLHHLIVKEADYTKEIHVYTHPVEALKHLQSNIQHVEELPNLIFLDINMPGMDGWEFLSEYSKLPFNNDKKPIVIMLSSSILRGELQRAQEHPCIAEFIQKPLTQNNLHQLANKYFIKN